MVKQEMLKQKWITAALMILTAAGLTTCSGLDGQISASGLYQEHTEDTADSSIFLQTTTLSFSETAVPQEITDALIEAALTSPTGETQRAHEIIQIRDRTLLHQIKTEGACAQALDSAPLLLVIAGNENQAVYPELLDYDCGIITQSILIQAGQLGLCSVSMRIAPQEEQILAAGEPLSLPQTLVPQMMIALGYPAEFDADSSASVYFYDEGSVYVNGYGS